MGLLSNIAGISTHKGQAVTDMLKPSAALLCKLGSIAVHAQELLSPGGHEFDRAALETLFNDAEVRAWIEQMDGAAMVPKPRSAQAWIAGPSGVPEFTTGYCQLDDPAGMGPSVAAVLKQVREVLDNTRGDINPERGYADESETEIVQAIAAIDSLGMDTPDGGKHVAFMDQPAQPGEVEHMKRLHRTHGMGEHECQSNEIRASCADSGVSMLKFHVVDQIGYRRRWEAVCGGSALMSQDTVLAHTISPASRCRKSLCQRQFFAADEEARTAGVMGLAEEIKAASAAGVKDKA